MTFDEWWTDHMDDIRRGEYQRLAEISYKAGMLAAADIAEEYSKDVWSGYRAEAANIIMWRIREDAAELSGLTEGQPESQATQEAQDE